jgi:dTDP-4-dehydrorhamnose 3,5-epimerase
VKFTKTELLGVWIIDLEKIEDERGYFARTWCAEEFRAHGLDASLVQCNTSFNAHRGTLRGMHYQADPHGEPKLIRCTRGAIYDVALDIRPGPTFGKWLGFELSAANARMIYLPTGIAHGFQTLEDNTEVFYQMGHTYHPQSARGIRWNDPKFAIKWPMAETIVSPKDLTYPDFKC